MLSENYTLYDFNPQNIREGRVLCVFQRQRHVS